MVKRIAVVYGLGGAWFDPPSGERQLVARLQQIGIDVAPAPFDYSDSQGIYEWLKDAQWRGIIGDSLGASYMPNYCEPLPAVDYCAGFQPSVYASTVHDGNEITIPNNVKQAHCIRDPNWIDTGGLGYAIWVAGPLVKLEITEIRAPHPDDYGAAQDLIFNEVKGLIT